jgi:energy-converting hydrogenase Eha subunit C
MALLIFPLALVLGWFVRPPGRAAVVTAAIGLIALAGYLLLGLAGVVVSPLETTVLLLGTPLAAFLAFRLAQWRAPRRKSRA